MMSLKDLRSLPVPLEHRGPSEQFGRLLDLAPAPSRVLQTLKRLFKDQGHCIGAGKHSHRPWL